MRRITRDGEPVIVGSRQLDVLLQFLSQPGLLLTKEVLIETAWREVAVTDNSLAQAVLALRRTFGDSFIETIPRQGYRLNVQVTRLPSRASDSSLDQLLAPHRAWIDGRAALESLERTEIVRARDVFEGILDSQPDQPSAHVGLANACVMQFEMTRADREPDVAARTLAEAHAREACRLDPDSGEAWATLGFVLERAGQTLDALAAVRRAATLEPDNWRHHFRRAYVSWGEERLRSAHRTLALVPGFPLAHVLAASVHVARQALDDALREVTAGLVAEDRQHGRRDRFNTVALHWLHGLLLFARGDAPGALAACGRELAAEGSGHLYAREFCANACQAMGAIHLSLGDRDQAGAAFGQALERIPGHPLAMLGLAASQGLLPTIGPLEDDPPAIAAALSHFERRLPAVERSLLRAAAFSLAGQPARGAAAVEQALRDAPPGNAAWTMRIDPLIRPWDHLPSWAPALACLQARAV